MKPNRRTALVLAAAVSSATLARAADLKILLPLGRQAYETSERIDVSVVRSSPQALTSGTLTLTLGDAAGGKSTFTFPTNAADVVGKDARRTEHLHLDGRLLRPGDYTLEVSADGATATAAIDVHPHLRKTPFKLIDWGSPTPGKVQAYLGPDSLGFNLVYAMYGGINADQLIRGGSDYMRCCTMSGAHQMDLRMECDWSDPYVLQGGEARVVAEALTARTRPNARGVHFYDEPGLTWWKPKGTTEVPFNIPSQDRSYQSAFGRPAPQYDQTKPDDAAAVARWEEMNRWKLSFMEAAWKYSSFGVNEVSPRLLPVTQSVYAFNAYADGYYFNVARPLPAISGHGGYSDWGPAYFNPVWTFEFGRVRDLDKPNWYLPMWYGNIGPDQYRLESNLCFIENLQGLAKPPDLIRDATMMTRQYDGIVETNKLAGRLGTIFDTMPVTRSPVAILYSMSQNLRAEVRDMQDPKAINTAAYEGGGHNRDKLFQAYLAGKMCHVSLFPVVEEDVVDGTLAAHHKAVVIPGVDYLEPRVVAALEEYVVNGGVVWVSDDSKVQIKGAKPLGIALDPKASHPPDPDPAEDPKAKHPAGWHPADAKYFDSAAHYYEKAAPVAKVLKQRLDEINVKPPLDADSPQIITERQACGDIEYLFAVNATYDASKWDRNATKAAEAKLSADAGGAMYDAIHGVSEAGFKANGGRLEGTFRFGPGQMRAFARTARPIGGVQINTPTVTRDFTQAADPIRVDVTALLSDDAGRVLAGSAPMRVRLLDPAGATRYDLYRATDAGILKLRLPLGANDPAGGWKVEVSELLSGRSAVAAFAFEPPRTCGALAGASGRAVYFKDDRDNAFRFFRLYRDVTIVKGKSDYDGAAADRLVQALKPWDVRCTVLSAADAAKARSIDADEAPTWCGLDAGRLKPGDKNAPSQVGFAIRGPVILVGTPEDNPILKFALDKSFLPYKPDAANFPGRGRGYVAWQRDLVSYGSESVSLIAYDAAGMDEAVGTLYEMAAAMDPLTPLVPADKATLTPAAATAGVAEAKVAWRTILPDTVVADSFTSHNGVTSFGTEDGSILTVSADGKLGERQDAPPREPGVPGKKSAASDGPKADAALGKSLLPNHTMKFAAKDIASGMTAVGYWGGAVQVFDAGGAVKVQYVASDDLAGLEWLGGRAVLALSDGELVALDVK